MVALLLVAVATPAVSQVVQGRLVAERGDAPIAGGLVHLVRASDDSVVSNTLTDRDGTFALKADTTGTYRLRAELIGYRMVETEDFALDSGPALRRDIRMPVRPVGLEAIVVSERPRCVVRPREGERLAVVWAEARKALSAAALTARDSRYGYRVETYERRLDARTGLVVSDSHRSRTTTARQPFRSLRPEEFRDRGWVHEGEGVLNYFAPDAAALLSPEFLESHCLQLAGTAGDSLVGIAFQPVGGRELPDIAGTLWLDRRTSELRSLDFRYVNLREAEASREAGGVVEFQRMPQGTWIVRRWRIRMPVLARTSVTSWRGRALPGSPKLLELKEDGGRVVEVRDATGQLIDVAARATMSGVVYDSTRMAPLPDARVSVVGTPYATTTDEAGRFMLTGLWEGDYQVSFDHPRADSLVLARPTTTRVAVVPAETVAVRLALPPEKRRLEAVCADEFADPEPPRGTVPGETIGTLVGRVRRADTGWPVPGAVVHLAWSRWSVEADASRALTTNVWEQPWRRTYETGAEGTFVACRLPALVPILVWPEKDGIAGDTARIRVPEGRFVQHDPVLPGARPPGNP